MSSLASSSKRPAFDKPLHFTRIWGSTGWFCNICSRNDTPPSMTVRAAIRHEHTSEHARNVSDYETWCPPADHTGWEVSEDQPLTVQELKVREKQARVDHVKHMVPWWVRAVEAAEKGEEMRMEEFLDTINNGDGWGPDGLVWGDEWGVVPDTVNGNDWANGGTWGDAPGDGGWTKPAAEWGMSGSASSLHARRTPTASSAGQRRRRNIAKRKEKRNVDMKGRRDSYRFVEDIAKQEAADAERKRRMHVFFEMPTQEKVKKIKEVIGYLRSTSHE